jgi:electron transfer flavoprotein alpha subunit
VTVRSLDGPSAGSRTRFGAFVAPSSAGDVDMAAVDFILSVGRGVGEEDNLEQFRDLAELIGATLGCSRPIADSGWLPKSRQVGQSGKTAANCKLYIAMGISGAIQHLAGMKHVDTVVAVNTDSNASIFSVAKYGIVADMFEIAEELRKQFA